MPGVTAVGASTVPLLTGDVERRATCASRASSADRTPTRTRASTRSARATSARSASRCSRGASSPPPTALGAPKVAIVNEAFAKKFGLGRDAVGKRMAVDGESPESSLDIEIVGLMRDASYSDVKERGAAARARAVASGLERRRASCSTCARPRAPERTLRAIPGAIARLDRNLPVSMLKTLPQQVRENVYLDRMIGTLAAGVRGARDAARGGRAVRRARVHRRAAHARDRRAHGARRRRRGACAASCCGRSRA